ncbi:retrovirus-related pol polyprotein from transposon TNT 1-94 [Tanacetum coccineum]
MFNEYFTPPSNAASQVQEATAPRAVDLADSLVSTSIDQDAPSSSTPSTQEQEQSSIVSQVEPMNFKQAMTEPSWISAMQEEIHEFKRLQVWELVPCPDKVLLIKLKWIYKVKIDEFHGILKKKARLVAQGFRQEEGIDFEELFAPVWISQKITRKQSKASKHGQISQYFSKGVVDPTLFTRQARNDLLLLVQIYVDDIIFASTNTAMCNEFANQMTTKFKMSMMGQMSFFLGLQISQSPRGIFINQSKYASEIVKKYGMLTTDSVDTPLVEKSNLDEDLQGKQVDATLYRGMIGSLMYLTSSRPDLIHAVCLCARYQAKPTEKHLQAVKRIFRYLKGTINMGLWYSKDTGMSLTAYADADHAGCQDTRRSTSGSAQFLGDKLVSWSSKKQKCTAISSTKAEYMPYLGVQVENGIVELYFVRTEYQLADIFTKPLPREIFDFLIEKLGKRSMSPETLKSLAEETDK